jgi:hypothetical protein
VVSQFSNKFFDPIMGDPPRYTIIDGNRGPVASKSTAGGGKTPPEEEEEEEEEEEVVLDDDQQEAEWHRLPASEIADLHSRELAGKARLLKAREAATHDTVKERIDRKINTTTGKLSRLGKFLKPKKRKPPPPAKQKLSPAQLQLEQTSGRLSQVLAEDGHLVAFLDMSARVMEQKTDMGHHFRKSASVGGLDQLLQGVFQHYADKTALEEFLVSISAEDVAQIAKHVVGAVEGKLIPKWVAVQVSLGQSLRQLWILLSKEKIAVLAAFFRLVRCVAQKSTEKLSVAAIARMFPGAIVEEVGASSVAGVHLATDIVIGIVEIVAGHFMQDLDGAGAGGEVRAGAEAGGGKLQLQAGVEAGSGGGAAEPTGEIAESSIGVGAGAAGVAAVARASQHDTLAKLVETVGSMQDTQLKLVAAVDRLSAKVDRMSAHLKF